MELSFVVGMPAIATSFMFADRSSGIENGSFTANMLAGSQLVADVKVSGFYGHEDYENKLIIKYKETFDPESTFAAFFERAENYARQYCYKIGLK
ncbi:hypothetical protein LGZ99_20295 [Photorhabdus temperata]|uniref:Uncharacterized protein n=2 Tax=Photorhabdus temperata TaxID=574560 RepID=U7QXE3_PHOTE|nr:hypothetical protein [Photorhabdus temperata]EQB98769.1 hypothetical protein B738_22240 [Photorhabdus temperata subsp. temperata M1021]ERT12734.1 hypothetical protein O185_12765 [Photorhabdus temperata J3]MCT8349470.1 hypothetical protein [Photorhabdus temperata]